LASGCGGAGCFRRAGPGAEALADILRVFPYWFGPRLKEYIASLKEFIASPESLVSSLRALCGALFGLVTAAGLAYLSWSWVIRNMPPAVQDMEKRSLGVLLIAAWGTWSVMAAGLCAIAIPFLLLACVLLLLFLRAKKARQPH